MDLFQFAQDNINLLAGNEQEFEELLAAKRVDDAKTKMDYRGVECAKALHEYLPHAHSIMKTPDKIKQDKQGNVVGRQVMAKLPISYQQYINEVALVFLFGQPVSWQQQTQGTDEAFAKFQNVIKKTHFNAKIRQCKRIAGAETESAMLFRVYRDDDGQPAMQLRVLAMSKGDEIYTRFDQYENLVAFAWGYYVKDKGDVTVYHFDVYTKDKCFYCAQKDDGWEVDEEVNIIGKIPVILFRQEKEWAGVEPLIDRLERMISKTADVNDYFADPFLIASADIIKSLPDKEAIGKLLVTNDTERDVKNSISYLTWDTAPQSKKDELELLQALLLKMTCTPDIQLDTLKSLGNLSGKALRTVMLLADIKAAKRKEIYDEMLDRTASLITTIIGNVLDVSLKSQCDALEVAHIWQEPFGEDTVSTLENIIKATEGGILSQESAIELNPLVTDSSVEKTRLEIESEEQSRRQTSLFGYGAGSYTTNARNNEEETQEVEEETVEETRTA